MLSNSGDSDPMRARLKTAIYRRLQAEGINDRITGVIQSAYGEVLRAEGIVLSRAEQKRLLGDIQKELLGALLKAQ